MEDRHLTFGEFHLDLTEERLLCNEEVVALTPKGFAVLRRLAEHGGQVVTKEELLQAGWAKTHVSDGVLKVIILEIRRALGDDPAAPGLPLHRSPHEAGDDPNGGEGAHRIGRP